MAHHDADLPESATAYVPLLEDAIMRLEMDYRVTELMLSRQGLDLFDSLTRPPSVRASDGRPIPIDRGRYMTGGWDFISVLGWLHVGARRKRRVSTILCPPDAERRVPAAVRSAAITGFAGQRIPTAEARETARTFVDLGHIDPRDLARVYAEARDQSPPATARSFVMKVFRPR